jgi:hypothetical protein
MKIFLTILALCTSASAQELNTATLLNGHESTTLLEKKCIETTVSGIIAPRWDIATQMLAQPDFIPWIQSAYQRSISTDGTLSFPITETTDGTYHYVNKKKQRTTIFELYRKQTSATTFDLIYLAKGKRFFGKYEVLIHVHAIDAGSAGTVYTASIHAYPKNGPLRFFARRMGSVERYFQTKTKMIANITEKICEDMKPADNFIFKSSHASL